MESLSPSADHQPLAALVVPYFLYRSLPQHSDMAVESWTHLGVSGVVGSSINGSCSFAVDPLASKSRIQDQSTQAVN